MLIDTLSRNSLLRSIQIVIGTVEKKQSLPILSNILVQRINGIVRLTATDLEMQVSTGITVSNSEGKQYSITIGAKKLLEILVKSEQDQEVQFYLEDKKITVRSGSSRFNLQTLPADDFPQINKPNETEKNIKLSQELLKRLLSQVKYAMAQQDIRYYLNGILLSVEGSRLNVVATDGHRLAYASITLDKEYPDIEAIIPRKAVNEIYRLLDDSNEEVLLAISESSILVKFSDIEFQSKIIDGKFPDYKRVIPEYKNSLELNRKSLLSALGRVSILTNEKFHGVRFILTEKNLKIFSSNSEQEEAQEDLVTSYQGEALDIGFNINYLLDGLSNINSSEIVMSFGGANSSVLISLPEEDPFRYVVMPMRI